MIRRRRLAAGAVALAAVVVAVFVLIVGAGSSARVRERQPSRPGGDHAAGAAGPSRPEVAAALKRGVHEAAELGGTVEAAATLNGWRRPLIDTSERAGSARWMRMWSMSKVVTMVSLLRAKGWGQTPGDPLSGEVKEALRRAITRSENCPQRRVVLELQAATGGTEGARKEMEETLREAGAEGGIGSEVAGPESSCVEYLEDQREIAEPLAATVLLGTSTWRVGDAVRFMRALGNSAYGKAISEFVLSKMRVPKDRSREILPSEYTVPVDWGAGHAFPGFDPAYKAGWGGTEQGAFLAGQMALLELPGGGRAELAVMFHPDQQPAEDDPGMTAAPQALARVMDSLATVLGPPS